MSTNWSKLQEFQHENPDLLIMIADPKTDEISISFRKQNAFTKFPFTDMSRGVVFNALRKSKFSEAIDAFMVAIIESTGIDVTNKDGNELLKLLGGAMRGLGVGEEASRLQVINKKTNAKSKKS